MCVCGVCVCVGVHVCVVCVCVGVSVCVCGVCVSNTRYSYTLRIFSQDVTTFDQFFNQEHYKQHIKSNYKIKNSSKYF